MNTICLRPFISEEQKDFTITQEAFDDFTHYIDELWDDFPIDFSFTVEAARDRDDDLAVFRDVKFRVMSRYKIDGDRYFSGDGFSVCVEDTLKLIKSKITS